MLPGKRTVKYAANSVQQQFFLAKWSERRLTNSFLNAVNSPIDLIAADIRPRNNGNSAMAMLPAHRARVRLSMTLSRIFWPARVRVCVLGAFGYFPYTGCHGG